jgi:uridylate kinase
MTANNLPYPRVLLKLSGEALLGNEDFGIDPAVLIRMAEELREVMQLGVQVGVVIGGGNIFRGQGLARAGMDRVTGDHMGMLATLINSLAFQDALERLDVMARVMSGLQINEVCEDFIRRKAIGHLEKGRVAIFGAGMGNPFFTTDTAASLRAIEIGADILLKATRVDGVYDSDPEKNPAAKRYDQLSYDTVIRDQLSVMDTTAIVMCRDNHLPIRVFDLHQPGNLVNLIKGAPIGTLITEQ